MRTSTTATPRRACTSSRGTSSIPRRTVSSRTLFTQELRIRNLIREDRDGNERIDFSKLNMRRFMARLLQLPSARQDQVFTVFFNRLQAHVEAAKAAGEYEEGIARFDAVSAKRASDTVIWARGGETVNLVELEVKRKVRLNTFADALARVTERLAPVVAWGKNKKSGRVYLFLPSTLAKRTGDKTVPGLVRIGVTGRALVKRGDITGDYGASDYYERIVIEDPGYQTLTPEQAAREWQQQHRDAPKTREAKAHFLTGGVMHLFDKLPDNYRPRLHRIDLDNGEVLVGMSMTEGQMNAFLSQGGIELLTEENQRGFLRRHGYGQDERLVLAHHGAELERLNRGLWRLTGDQAWLDSVMALDLPEARLTRAEASINLTTEGDPATVLAPLFAANPPAIFKRPYLGSFSLGGRRQTAAA